ncbi:uncharacterized protein SPSC_02107 [Sporisorium scitamineum]|uniref:Uncharacterized protein n=1 Tax=Sporisorium scitamineum TaxID=49012 RepID=A0A0F7SCL7_9BASI|nr:uncharacterized protein SPSC_02107 [Sporisorium scitamineum]CDW99085.1 hypothetical protein [Sporisorium scitamineum]
MMKSRILLSGFLNLSLLVLVLIGLSCMAAPMGPTDTAPTSIAPQHIRDLSTEDLFKTMIIHDTSLQIPTTTPPASPTSHSSIPSTSSESNSIKVLEFLRLPSWLDYPVTQPNLVRFSTHAPPVLVSHNPSDVTRSIESHAFYTYYVRLNQNHDATRPPATGWGYWVRDWFSQISANTRADTTQQVAEEGKAAKRKAKKWALGLVEAQGGDGGTVVDEIEKSLEKTWSSWMVGFREATGYAVAPLGRVKPKILRRRRR